jgi:hypothetical protein
MREKQRRGVAGDIQIGRIAIHQFGGRLLADEVISTPNMSHRVVHFNHRIDQHGKVGPAGLPLNRIGILGFSRIKLRCRRAGQMSTGAESHDADTFWIDVPSIGIGMHDPQRAMHILHRHRFRIGSRRSSIRHAMDQHKRGHAMRVEHAGDIPALFVKGENAISTAGDDHASRAIGIGVDRKKYFDPRVADVRDMPIGLIG